MRHGHQLQSSAGAGARRTGRAAPRRDDPTMWEHQASLRAHRAGHAWPAVSNAHLAHATRNAEEAGARGADRGGDDPDASAAPSRSRLGRAGPQRRGRGHQSACPAHAPRWSASTLAATTLQAPATQKPEPLLQLALRLPSVRPPHDYALPGGSPPDALGMPALSTPAARLCLARGRATRRLEHLLHDLLLLHEEGAHDPGRGKGGGEGG